MHHQGAVRILRDSCIIDAQPVIGVRLPKLAQDTTAKNIHGMLFQPAAGFFRQHHHHLRPAGFLQPFLERLTDTMRREILVFDIDPSFRRTDTIHIEPFDLPYRLLFPERREGSGDRHRNTAKIRLQVERPWISIRRFIRLHPVVFFRMSNGWLAAGPRPGFPGEIAQHLCRLAVDRHLDIVKRLIMLARRIDPAVVLKMMIRSVPSPFAQVESPHKGHGVVHDHDFLMLRCADRMIAVEAEMDAVMRLGIQFVPRKEFAFHRIYHGEIPADEINVEPLPFCRHAVEKRTEPDGIIVRFIVADQPQIAVKIPANHENGMARPAKRFVYGAKVCFPVDDERCPSGGRHLVTVFFGFKYLFQCLYPDPAIAIR